MYQDGVQRESKEIDGDTYSIVLMSVSQSLTLGDKILKLVGPALEAAPKVDGETKVTTALVLDLVAKSLSKLDGAKLLTIVKEAMQFVELEQSGSTVSLKTAFDTHFRQKFDTLVRVLRFFLEVQYGSFSKLLGDAVTP